MADLLAELLSSRVRAAVLGHLLPRPHLGFSLTELSRRLDLPISSLQHECYKLKRLGVLRDERAGAARRYSPDLTWPLAPPLAALVFGAIGMQVALAGAVEGVVGLEQALVAGVMTAERAGDSVYLVVVGELTIDEIDALLARVAAVLEPVVGANRLELAFFRPVDWRERQATGNVLVAEMLAGPVMVLAAAGERGGRR